jgi:PQQ-like domain
MLHSSIPRSVSLPLLTVLLAGAAASIQSVVACSSQPVEDGVSEQALGASGVFVLTQHNDVGRTGATASEKILNPTNVTASKFGKVFSRTVDGQVYAQPLYVGGVGNRNLVYVATEHNSVYAFDADDAAATRPVWQTNFGPSVPSVDTSCSLLAPEIGITSTPVIDTASGTMWVSAKSKEGGRYIHRLHAIEIATGKEKPNSPVEMTASVRGDGDGSVNGVITLDPLKHLNRPGLLKVGNTIYLAFASQCDVTPYHGWVLAYDATTLKQVSVHNNTPNGGEGGIWHGAVGLASDAVGDVYYVSGNGTFDGRKNFGNSVVRLKPQASGLSVSSFFTPGNSNILNAGDLDIGSTGQLLIPGTNLLVAGSKSGVFYVVDRTNMGGFKSDDSQIVQRFQGTTKGAFGGAAYFDRKLFVWGTGDKLKAYGFNGNTFATTPTVGATPAAAFPGGQISVSSNGTAGSGVVWTVRPAQGGTGLSANPGAGIVQAFASSDITRELWNSNSTRDNLGSIAKFASPTIANGRVYIGTGSRELVVYGLLGSGAAVDAGAPIDSGIADAGRVDANRPPDAGTQPRVTFTELYQNWIGPQTPGHCSNTSCHQNLRGGFRCGDSKASCFQGLVTAGLVLPANPKASRLGASDSPLSWFGGGMPLDNPVANPKGAAAVTNWLANGAKND